MNWSTDWEAAAAYASPETQIIVGHKDYPSSYFIVGFPPILNNGTDGYYWTPCPLIEEAGP